MAESRCGGTEGGTFFQGGRVEGFVERSRGSPSELDSSTSSNIGGAGGARRSSSSKYDTGSMSATTSDSPRTYSSGQLERLESVSVLTDLRISTLSLSHDGPPASVNTAISTSHSTRRRPAPPLAGCML